MYAVTILIQELLTRFGDYPGRHYDFIAFYSAASLTFHGHVAQVYDPGVVTSFERTIVPYPVGTMGYLALFNPPFVAVLLAPLGLVTIFKARLAWFAINATAMGLATYWLTKPLRKTERIIGTLLIMGSFPVYQALVEGQLSILVFVGAVLGLYFGQKKQYIASGISLSLLWIKPQFAVLAIIGLAIVQKWRALASMCAATLGLILILLPITGVQLYATYIPLLFDTATAHFNGGGFIKPTVWGGYLDLAEGINGFYVSLFGQTAISIVNIMTGSTVLSLGMVYLLALRKVKPGLSNKDRSLMFGVSIALGLLINPHLYVQDLVLIFLLVPALMAYDHKLLAISNLVLLTDIAFIDQGMRLHTFTLLLALGAIGSLLKIITPKVLSKKFSPKRKLKPQVALTVP
jgi:hypothetical protein